MGHARVGLKDDPVEEKVPRNDVLEEEDFFVKIAEPVHAHT